LQLNLGGVFAESLSEYGRRLQLSVLEPVLQFGAINKIVKLSLPISTGIAIVDSSIEPIAAPNPVPQPIFLDPWITFDFTEQSRFTSGQSDRAFAHELGDVLE
jgi:hypothetical protein